ncbi:MAG TPA: DNA recombination protein RmuC [Nitrospiria bacterium]|nr:DNA recombination protein RmuC [Nitrospiria bacterium]
MEPLWLIAALLVALILVVGVALFRRRPDPTITLLQQQLDAMSRQLSESAGGSKLMHDRLGQVTQEVNGQLSAITTQVNGQLGLITAQVNQQLTAIGKQVQEATGQMGTRLDNAARVVGEVRQNLGELTKATERVFDVGKDIASLQEILRAPKLRGVLGELFLGDLLGQILPPTHYALQYKFKSGEAVDAAIHLGQGIVPVDSKFPLENFRRVIASEAEDERKAAKKKFVIDVKKHIDAIASKYILPDEGTFDFALMYIPAENVYYEVILKDDAFGEDKGLCAYALAQRVIPVSPNSFYAYLQAIVLGLKGLRIEKNAQEMIQHLKRLQGDFQRFRDDFDVLGKHLGNTRGKYEDASKRLERFGEKLLSVEESAAAPTSIEVDAASPAQRPLL